MLDHPFRHVLNDELHGRPGLPVVAPARITHMAFTLGARDGDPLPAVRKLCEAKGIRPPADKALHHGVEVDGGLFKYERHGEFYRLSVSLMGKSLRGEAVEWLPAGWLDTLPGQRLVAIHTHVIAKSTPPPTPSQLRKVFGHDEIASSRVNQGKSTVWSDFRIGGDGFTRMLIHDGGLTPHRLGRLTRRLHEIETYRMMALLALPLARDLQPRLSQMEIALSGTIEHMAIEQPPSDDADLLRQLMTLSRDIEQMSNQSNYRFSAARAYAALVAKRVAELGEDRVDNHQRLGVFLDRRFSPAMATCAAVESRIAGLAQRCERASNLLRTRVDIALEGQNQRLLQSMEKRGRQQLMLQETVEGLSVAAISYYVIGIVAKLIEGAAKFLPPFDEKLAQFISIPLVIVLVWLAARHIKKKVHKAAGE